MKELADVNYEKLKINAKYHFMGYEWVVAAKHDMLSGKKYVTLQADEGITVGRHPHCIDIENGKTPKTDYAFENISEYYPALEKLYDRLKPYEAEAESLRGKGLFLVSESYAGRDIYNEKSVYLLALRKAAMHPTKTGGSWTGSCYRDNICISLNMDSVGKISHCPDNICLAIAPAFNLDLSQVNVGRNMIYENQPSI